MAARAGAGRRGPRRRGGLPGAGQIEQLLGEHRTDAKEDILNRGELGAPGRALGAVELVDGVLGDAFAVGPQLLDRRGARLGWRHPWLLSELGSKGGTHFLQPRYDPPRQLQTMSCVHEGTGWERHVVGTSAVG